GEVYRLGVGIVGAEDLLQLRYATRVLGGTLARHDPQTRQMHDHRHTGREHPLRTGPGPDAVVPGGPGHIADAADTARRIGGSDPRDRRRGGAGAALAADPPAEHPSQATRRRKWRGTHARYRDRCNRRGPHRATPGTGIQPIGKGPAMSATG